MFGGFARLRGCLLFNAASVPLWVALVALVGTFASPIIQGRMARNSPQSKADAAAKYTEIANKVTESNEKLRASNEKLYEDNEKLHDRLRRIEPMLRELIRLLDEIVPTCDPAGESVRLRQVIDSLRETIS